MMCIEQNRGELMITLKKCAGIATCLGLMGLAVTPFVLSPVAAASSAASANVSVAIAAGPQLRLLRADQFQARKLNALAGRQDMICEIVYKLPIADVGLNCKSSLDIAPIASAT